MLSKEGVEGDYEFECVLAPIERGSSGFVKPLGPLASNADVDHYMEG
jgi:hypothetical protein